MDSLTSNEWLWLCHPPTLPSSIVCLSSYHPTASLWPLGLSLIFQVGLLQCVNANNFPTNLHEIKMRMYGYALKR